MESRIDATHAPSLLPEGKHWTLVWNDELTAIYWTAQNGITGFTSCSSGTVHLPTRA